MMSLTSRAGMKVDSPVLIESKASRAVQSPQAPAPRGARERRAERLPGRRRKMRRAPGFGSQGCQRRRPARAPACGLT